MPVGKLLNISEPLQLLCEVVFMGYLHPRVAVESGCHRQYRKQLQKALQGALTLILQGKSKGVPNT